MKRKPALLFLLFTLFQLAWFSSIAQEAHSYKNRIGINALGLPSENLVLSYEHSFGKNGLWMGLEHRLNQLSEEKDQQVNSIALEYRYYFFTDEKLAEGLFAGVYSKYRWGEENTTSGNNITHEYQAVFSGLNAGYRYNYRRLALSAFLGYGLPLWTTEATSPVGATHELNENFQNDLRIGLTLGFGF